MVELIASSNPIALSADQGRVLTAKRCQGLTEVPSELEWFANIDTRALGARVRMRCRTSVALPGSVAGGRGPLSIAAPAKWIMFDLLNAEIQLNSTCAALADTASLVRAHGAYAAARTKLVLAPSEIARVELFRRGILCSTKTSSSSCLCIFVGSKVESHGSPSTARRCSLLRRSRAPLG